MAGVAAAGALIAGALNVAGEAVTLGAGVVPALSPWWTEECPGFGGRGGPLSDVWRRPLPWYRRWALYGASCAFSFSRFQMMNHPGRVLQSPGLERRRYSGRVQGTSEVCVLKIRSYNSRREIVWGPH